MPNTLLPDPSHEMPRQKNGLPISTHLYLAVGMALLLGILVASYMQASAGLDALKQFGAMNLRADHLDRLNQLLSDAQSSVRGYALTHDQAYLDTYRATRPQIHQSLEIIKRDEKEGPQASAVDKLATLAENLTARMELTTRHVREGAALEKSWFDQSTAAMETYRRQHAAIKATLVTESMQNVKQSVRSFETSRLTAAILAGSSLTLLVLVISQQQKKQDLRERIQGMLEAENERLENEVRTRTAELTNLATYLTRVRETEKLDLAREMHDELGALLTAAKLDADWIERKLPPDAQAAVTQRLVRLRQNLISGITLKRRITNNLRPALLYDLGLIEALKALVDEFRQSEEIDVVAELPESEPEFSDDLSLSLFRIIQEAFTNIRKYAQARHVRVSLRMTPKAIELEIEDDGIGFDPGSPKLARHGLAGIKHRVFTHGGQLQILTAPGKGVTIQVTLPA
ncbi:MAG TPA: ATP-binding protein [Gammaproteobacteria bacterium]